MPKGRRVTGVAMPITPNDDQKNPAASHAQVKEPCPCKARGRRGVNRLGGPLKAPRAAGQKWCHFRQSTAARGCHGVPCARRMIPLESLVREIRPLGSESGDWETGPRRGVRHRHCESRREQLPPPPTVTAPVADSTTMAFRPIKRHSSLHYFF